VLGGVGFGQDNAWTGAGKIDVAMSKAQNAASALCRSLRRLSSDCVQIDLVPSMARSLDQSRDMLLYIVHPHKNSMWFVGRAHENARYGARRK
jgi:hypothetical protein